MVQVLPETSNSNLYLDSFRRTFSNAQEGFEQGKKQALLDSIANPNATAVQKASAQEKYLQQFGKPDDLIKFQREQGRQQAVIDIKKLLGGETLADNQAAQSQFPGNQNFNPNQEPVTAENLMRPKPPVDPKAINSALLNLAQYDPQAANTIGGILDRKQKSELAKEKQALATEQFQYKKQQDEEARRFKNKESLVTIQEDSMKGLQAGEKQLQSIDTLDKIKGDVTAFSGANLSDILGKIDNPAVKAIGNLIQTPAGAAFKTASKAGFAGLKELWGAKPTEFETKIYTDMHAQIGRSELANDASLTLLKQPLQKSIEENRFRLETIAENPDIDVQQLQTATYQHMKEYSKELKKEFDEKVELWLNEDKERLDKTGGWFGVKKKSRDKTFGAMQEAVDQQAASEKPSLDDIWK